MSDEEKLLQFLGLAARGRNVESGEFAVEKAVKAHKARLVLIAADASDNTKKKFQNMCQYHKVPCSQVSDRAGLGHAIGRDYRACIAVTDAGMAKTIMTRYEACLKE